MRPDTDASWAPCRRPISHWGTTTSVWPGAAWTSGGAGPSHRVRRSRQRAVWPSPTRRHDGAGATPVVGGSVVVGELLLAVTRFRATDGERRFSNTPEGPMRRYGSP